MERNKVYVVKSVNVDKNSVILPEDEGLGVFLTYDEAKVCFDKIVSDLKELYEDFDPDDVDTRIDENGGLNSFWIYNQEVGFCDFVGLYECEHGQWNGWDMNWFNKQ